MADQRGRIRVETGRKRVRAHLGGALVLDTGAPRLVWEKPYYPAYYIPRADVADGVLEPSERTERSASRGEARYFHVTGGDTTVADGAWTYPESPIGELADLVRFDWDAMDAWFEEDVEVFVHPRDPYTRVDALASSRHVRIEVDGVTVADTRHPTVLFETGLPPRWYVPKHDVRMDLLEPTDSRTHCPYKGTASYWSLRVGDAVHEDLVWSYPSPLPESGPVAGLVCFYDERVDVTVDGVPQARPRTQFS